MIEYLIKFFTLSLLSYLACRLFINYCQNYKASRFWLLFCLCFSVLIPLISFEISANSIISTINLEQMVVNDDLNIASSPLVNSEKKAFSGKTILIAIYIITVLALTLRFYLNIKSLLKKQKDAEQVNYNGHAIYLLDENVKPFTFLKSIFINKQDWLTHKNKPELINHEIHHKNLNHSLDILFIEFLKVIFWFNPVLYAYKTLIQSNHEYQVDNAIISNGVDAKSYTHIIIDYTFKPKTKYYSLSSGFSLSLIKNRIHMISKFKKNSSFFKQSILIFSLLSFMFLSTAFRLDTSGYFLADKVFYSQQEHKLYLEGENIEVSFLDNDISGRGTFSFLGAIDYLEINDEKITQDKTIEIKDKKCLISQIISDKELFVLGLNENSKAFKITIIEE